MKQFFVVMIITLSTVPAFSQAKSGDYTAPTSQQHPTPGAAAASTVPTLSAEQREQVKNFQLNDANLTVEIMRAQQQQKDNQQAGSQYVQSLCKSTNGKIYQIHFPDLTCIQTGQSPPLAGK
jgi:hypothetical protein